MSARKNYALNPSSDLEASASGQHSWVFAQIVALGPVKKKKRGKKCSRFGQLQREAGKASHKHLFFKVTFFQLLRWQWLQTRLFLIISSPDGVLGLFNALLHFE